MTNKKGSKENPFKEISDTMFGAKEELKKGVKELEESDFPFTKNWNSKENEGVEKIKEKTHWLQTPNKNYLGHFDLPNGNDVILTIESAKWETVRNPITRESTSKRVIRFQEKYKWVKPFICNETNAKMIIKSTGQKFMEDCAGFKIKIGVSKTRMMGEEVDCLRVRNSTHKELSDNRLTIDQIKVILDKIPSSGKTEKDICAAYKVGAIKDIPLSKFKSLSDRLDKLARGDE